MGAFFLDTSALGKRYVDEKGSAWIRTLTAPASDNTLLMARITMVEMFSALSRRKREGSVLASACETAANAFTIHCATEYLFIEFNLEIVDRARDLLERYPLRTIDSVQLASALVANKVIIDHELRPLVFVSADARLLQVASDQDLVIENPNLYT